MEPVDDRRHPGAPNLIAGDNFGCGSSREYAAQAMADRGKQAVIAPSSSDIFAGSAVRNGIISIALDALFRRCPMEGLDEIGLTLARSDRITQFERTMDRHRPWIAGRSRYEGIAVAGARRT